MALLRRAYWWLGIPSTLALATLVFGSVGMRNVADDAFILLVYVRHLVERGSIYWNVEEGHVDGCTSMLDLLFKSLVQVVTRGDDLALMNWVVTLVLLLAVGLAALVIFGKLAKERSSPWTYAVAIVAAFAIGGHRAAAEGSSFLLETPIYLLTVLVTIGMLVFVRRWTLGWLVAFGVACALTMLARPEAVVIVTLLLAYLMIALPQADVTVASPRRVLVAPMVAFGIIGLYLLWHTIYFGHWAPNTYYAKKSENRWLELEDGINYVRSFVWSKWGKVAIATTVLAPLMAFARPWSDARYRRLFVVIAVAGVLNLASIIVAGGDCYFGLGRFLASASVLSILALGVAAIHLQSHWRYVAAAPLLALAYGNIVAAGTGLPRKFAHIKKSWPLESHKMGCDIDAVAALKKLGITSFGQTDQQRFKYFDDDLRVIDASGLNDREAAHTKVHARVLWGKGGVAHAVRKGAEAMSYGYRYPYTPQPMADYSSRELVYDDWIREQYIGSVFGESYFEESAGQLLYERFRPASVPACKQWFNFWVRDDVAERLEGREDVRIGRRDPARAVPLDAKSGVQFEGFGPVEHVQGGTTRRSASEGAVHIEANSPWLASMTAAPCTIGVMTGPGAAPLVVRLDGEIIHFADHHHRYRVPPRPDWDGAKPHDVHLEAWKGQQNMNVVLTGIFFEECDSSGGR